MEPHIAICPPNPVHASNTAKSKITDSAASGDGLDPQLLVVTEEYDIKIASAPNGFDDDYDGRAEVCGKLNNVSKIACSPDRSLLCVRNGDLYAGPLPINKDEDWFSDAEKCGWVGDSKCGWDQMKIIFFHPNGDLYAVTNDGDLYRGPKPHNKDVCWHHCVATKIGSGDWHEYGALFFDREGVLYAVCKDDSLVKGEPPIAPGNWLESTTRIGKAGWLKLTHFMAIGPDGKLWCVDKNDGKIYKGFPPANEEEDYINSAENFGFSYHNYKFLCFI